MADMTVDEAVLAARNNGNCDEDCCQSELAVEVERLRGENAELASFRDKWRAGTVDNLCENLTKLEAELAWYRRWELQVQKLRQVIVDRYAETQGWAISDIERENTALTNYEILDPKP